MSSPLAIGAISAVLCNLLDDGMVEHVGGALGSTVKVSSVAPDLVPMEEPEAPPRLNLFLYRVSPNQGWWNTGLPTHSAAGDPLGAPPLALNLHYLLTAYAQADFQAEVLLGYAMHLLHERPVLDRATLRTALAPSPLGTSILPAAFAALTPADLADQAGAITISPEPFDTEQMARLWTAIQAHYRPTAAYVVSVVLIQAARAQVSALPVLSRGPVDPVTGLDRGPVTQPTLSPPYPTLTAVTVPAGQAAAQLGDPITLVGTKLSGTAATVTFEHRLLSAPNVIAVGASVEDGQLTVTLPSGPGADAGWPAGIYGVTLSVQPPGDDQPRITNASALLLAPVASLPPTSLHRDPVSRQVSVGLNVSPQVVPGQDTWLFLGGVGAPAQPHVAATSSLSFVLPDVAAGPQWLRLRVDGVESLLVDLTPPPTFDASQTVSVPT